jgi:hypothetical protein
MLECRNDIGDPGHFMLPAIENDRKGWPTNQLLPHRPPAIAEEPQIQATW